MTDDVPVCDQCGRQHLTYHGGQACTGHKSANNPRDPGGPCATPPIDGLTVCRVHGGSAPQSRAAARRKVAERDAQVAIAQLVPDQPEPVRDPIAVLARLAGEADAVRGVAARLIVESELETVADLEQIQGLAAWFERWHDRTVRACETLVKSNYLERHAAIEEAQLAGVLAAVRDGLTLIPDDETRQAVTEEIIRRLRQLPGAA